MVRHVLAQQCLTWFEARLFAAMLVEASRDKAGLLANLAPVRRGLTRKGLDRHGLGQYMAVPGRNRLVAAWRSKVYGLTKIGRAWQAADWRGSWFC